MQKLLIVGILAVIASLTQAYLKDEMYFTVKAFSDENCKHAYKAPEGHTEEEVVTVRCDNRCYPDRVYKKERFYKCSPIILGKRWTKFEVFKDKECSEPTFSHYFRPGFCRYGRIFKFLYPNPLRS